MPITTSAAQDAIEKIATCLCAALEAAGGPTLCFCGVLAGEAVSADYGGPCGDACGMAWVRFTNAYPSTVLGAQHTEAGNCATMLGLDVELGVLRCISPGDDSGNPPTPAQWLAATQLATSDMMAMRSALVCCGFGNDLIVGMYTPIGPQGGLVGGAFQAALQVP